MRVQGLQRVAAAVSLLLATVVSANAQTVWPSQPVKLIVPFPPGGAADLTARTLAERMGAALGQAIVVENRTGSNGVIGMDAVAKAKPDGYTILMTDRGSLGINPSLYASLPYDPLKAFDYIGIATEGPVVMVTDPKLGLKSVADLVALAKSKPTNYGSYGIGSLAQINFEQFAQHAGVKMVHIPYKGSAPAALAVIQGDVAVSVAAPSTVLAHHRAGRVTAIAVNTEKRLAQFPDVLSFAEQGMPNDVMASTFFALAAPAGTPAAVIARYHAELKTALTAPAVTEKLQSVGLVPGGTGPEETAKTVASDIARFGAIVRALAIKPE